MTTRDRDVDRERFSATQLAISFCLGAVPGSAFGVMFVLLAQKRGVENALTTLLYYSVVGALIPVLLLLKSYFGAKWCSRLHSNWASTEAADQRVSDWIDSSPPAEDAEESVLAEKPANSSPQSAAET